MLPATRHERGIDFWGVLCAVLALSGCNDGIQRHQVSGTVTYRGKPVEMGTIRFEAESTAGDVTPASYAQIVDGKYETKSDESPASGKYRVLVMGIDVPRIKKEPGMPWEMPALFQPFQTKLEIPAPEGKFDIEIPDKKGQ